MKKQLNFDPINELKEIQRHMDLAEAYSGDFSKAAQIIFEENRRNELKEFEAIVNGVYDDFLSRGFNGDHESFGRSIFMKLCAAGVEGHRIRKLAHKTPSKKPAGRKPVTWGENGREKLIVFELVERQIRLMKINNKYRVTISDAITKLLSHLSVSTRSREIVRWKSAYSEAKAMLKNLDN